MASSMAWSQQGDVVATQDANVRVETVVDGLEHPWAVEVLPDGAYIVTERPGRLRIVRDGALSDPLGGLPEIRAAGQGGLLDVALAPDFAQSRLLFLTASVPGEGGAGTAVFRAKLSADEKKLENVERIFAMNKFTGAGQHFGSRIAIDRDGALFFGIGDRGDGPRAQDPKDHAGKLMRISQDGKVPADNPFAKGGDALPEIWSMGHRNPQGITIDPADGRLITVEHGARGGDEINVPQAGKNYGWPVISYGVNYSGSQIGEGSAKEGLEQPLHYWDPSIAPGAIAIYRGEMFPEWDGDFIVAALKYQLISRVPRDADGSIGPEERLFQGDYGRIRDVVVAPDGALLMVTDEDNGALLRVSRASNS
ncbi:PQQ-dependent sugar dehydrogenase [Rhizobium sp. RU36D]|uniref:PQQ-dependent sugar dehydrogenase n=1 Tax=Rhizobium sp. RU36D TaxID=1907415 RepID=UPI001FCDD2B9|nr:PQQ-dependent sugar dehydrogenase [Rhizobium sp. RU36D]